MLTFKKKNIQKRNNYFKNDFSIIIKVKRLFFQLKQKQKINKLN